MNAKELISIILAGILYVMAFPPFNFKFLIYISLIIFLSLILMQSKKNAMIISFIYGLIIFSLGTSWIFNSIYTYGNGGIVLSSIITVIFILIQSSYFLIIGFFVNRNYFDRESRYSIFAPASFLVLAEFARSYLFTGFPWLIIGYSQIHTIFDNIYPILGSYFVSFITIFIATYLAIMFVNKKISIDNKPILLSIILILLIFQYNNAWVEDSDESVSFAIIQPNIKQDEKFIVSNLNEIKQRYILLSRDIETELIIMPETALPTVYTSNTSFYRDKILKKSNSLISGIFRRDKNNIFNSMILLDNTEQYYDKRHLVPFGEYTPFESMLAPLAKILAIPMSNLSSGDLDQNIFRFKNFKLIPIICFESAYSSLIETDDNDYSIIVNVSNDSWFGNSFAPHQHLQITQIRAIEFQRNLIRAANTGISAYINKHGVIVKKLNYNTFGVIESDIAATKGSTPFSRFGHYPVLMLIFIIIILYVAKIKEHE